MDSIEFDKTWTDLSVNICKGFIYTQINTVRAVMAYTITINNAIQHLQEHVSLLDNNIYLSPLSVSSLHVIHYNCH